MRKDVLDFFASHSLEATKLIDMRPKYLNPQQVEKAMEKVFDQMQNFYNPRSGSYIITTEYNPRFLASKVWTEARNVRYQEYLNDQKLINKFKQILSKENRKTTIYKWLFILMTLSTAFLVIERYFKL